MKVIILVFICVFTWNKKSFDETTYSTDAVSGKKSRQVLSLTLSDSVVPVNSTIRNIHISIRYNSETEPVSIENWVVMVVKNSTDENSAVKIFAGGNIPPSGITWDGYADDGNICPPGNYYVRIKAVDRKNRRIVSPWKKCIIK